MKNSKFSAKKWLSASLWLGLGALATVSLSGCVVVPRGHSGVSVGVAVPVPGIRITGVIPSDYYRHPPAYGHRHHRYDRYDESRHAYYARW